MNVREVMHELHLLSFFSVFIAQFGALESDLGLQIHVDAAIELLKRRPAMSQIGTKEGHIADTHLNARVEKRVYLVVPNGARPSIEKS